MRFWETPVHIPNTMVKTEAADNTILVTGTLTGAVNQVAVGEDLKVHAPALLTDGILPCRGIEAVDVKGAYIVNDLRILVIGIDEMVDGGFVAGMKSYALFVVTAGYVDGRIAFKSAVLNIIIRCVKGRIVLGACLIHKPRGRFEVGEVGIPVVLREVVFLISKGTSATAPYPPSGNSLKEYFPEGRLV